jgi:hypothetical protein
MKKIIAVCAILAFNVSAESAWKHDTVTSEWDDQTRNIARYNQNLGGAWKLDCNYGDIQMFHYTGIRSVYNERYIQLRIDGGIVHKRIRIYPIGNNKETFLYPLVKTNLSGSNDISYLPSMLSGKKMLIEYYSNEYKSGIMDLTGFKSAYEHVAKTCKEIT